MMSILRENVLSIRNYLKQNLSTYTVQWVDKQVRYIQQGKAQSVRYIVELDIKGRPSPTYAAIAALKSELEQLFWIQNEVYVSELYFTNDRISFFLQFSLPNRQRKKVCRNKARNEPAFLEEKAKNENSAQQRRFTQHQDVTDEDGQVLNPVVTVSSDRELLKLAKNVFQGNNNQDLDGEKILIPAVKIVAVEKPVVPQAQIETTVACLDVKEERTEIECIPKNQIGKLTHESTKSESKFYALGQFADPTVYSKARLYLSYLHDKPDVVVENYTKLELEVYFSTIGIPINQLKSLFYEHHVRRGIERTSVDADLTTLSIYHRSNQLIRMRSIHVAHQHYVQPPVQRFKGRDRIHPHVHHGQWDPECCTIV